MSASADGRLAIAAARLRHHRLPSGSWGQRPSAERGNVIAAAQGLRVLRAAGAPLADADVAATLAYLADETLRHATDVRAGGRGEFSRYVTFSLEGLAEYPEARGLPGLAERIEQHVDWLLARQTAGGWAETRGLEPSSFATARAVLALRRAGAPIQAIKDGAAALLELRTPHGCWAVEQRPSRGSAGLTAAAVRALAGLSPSIDHELSRAGAWLAATRRTWLRQVETEELPGVTWVHPSYASAVAALAQIDLLDAAAEQAVREFLDELWSDDQQGWRLPSETAPSTRGAHAAVECLEALGAAAVQRAVAGRVVALDGQHAGGDGWTIELRDRPDLAVRAPGYARSFAIRPRLWDLLAALAREAAARPDRRVRRDRVAVSMGSSSPGTLSKEVTRMHEALAAATGGRVAAVVTGASRGWWRVLGVILHPAV